jgi:NitT/TauT family transport system permease protein
MAQTELNEPTLAGLAGEVPGGESVPVHGREASTARRYWPASLALLVFVLAAWQYAGTSGMVHRIILPPPSEIAAAVPDLVADRDFGLHLGTTLAEIVLGFLLGSLVGLGLGVALALSPLLRRTYFPLVTAFQATPRVILAPLVITWFGFGIESKVIQAIILSFYPVFLNTLVGLSLTEENALRLMHSLGASRWQTFVKLRLPDALPTIFAGAKVALTFAMIGAIIAEFVGAENGLGYLLSRYNFELRISAVYVLIVLLALIGLGFYLLLEWTDRRLVFWRIE